MFNSHKEFKFDIYLKFNISIMDSKIPLLKNKIFELVYKEIELNKNNNSFKEFLEYLNNNFELGSSIFPDIKITKIKDYFYLNNIEIIKEYLSLFKSTNDFFESKKDFFYKIYFLNLLIENMYTNNNIEFFNYNLFNIKKELLTEYKFLKKIISKEDLYNYVISSEELLNIMYNFVLIELNHAEKNKQLLLKKIHYHNNLEQQQYILIFNGFILFEGIYSDLLSFINNNEILESIIKRKIFRYSENNKFKFYKYEADVSSFFIFSNRDINSLKLMLKYIIFNNNNEKETKKILKELKRSLI